MDQNKKATHDDMDQKKKDATRQKGSVTRIGKTEVTITASELKVTIHS